MQETVLRAREKLAIFVARFLAVLAEGRIPKTTITQWLSNEHLKHHIFKDMQIEIDRVTTHTGFVAGFSRYGGAKELV